MRVALLNTKIPFVTGGAEVLARELSKALLAAGHEADVFDIPFQWSPPERVAEHLLACRLLDLTQSMGVPVDLAIGLRFPAYLVPHPNKVLWVIHQHKAAYEEFREPAPSVDLSPGALQMREVVRQADRRLIPEARAVYTISSEVTRRLRASVGVESEVLHVPPSRPDLYRGGEDRGYLFFPSRMTPLKRQELVLRALPETRSKARVVFAGVPDVPAYGRSLSDLARELAVADRVEWHGQLEMEEMRDLYAHCRAVLFPVRNEDFGLIVPEAMLSSKPVVVCKDSGGPLDLVSHEETGWITEPSPTALAQAMDILWEDPALAARLGRQARERYLDEETGWDGVVQRLLG